MNKQFPETKDELRLHNEEKNAMRSVIEFHLQKHPSGHIPSPWYSRWNIASMSVLAALFLCIGVSSAAAHAAPGDLLYPVKKHFNEPVRFALSVSSEAKARTARAIANERVAEARLLSARHTLDAEVVADLQASFDAHRTIARMHEEKAGLTFVEDADVSTPNSVYARILEEKESTKDTIAVPATSVPVPVPVLDDIVPAVVKMPINTVEEVVPAVSSTSESIRRSVQSPTTKTISSVVTEGEEALSSLDEVGTEVEVTVEASVADDSTDTEVLSKEAVSDTVKSSVDTATGAVKEAAKTIKKLPTISAPAL